MDDPGPEFIFEISDVELDALVETMYLVAFADGDYTEPERLHFGRCLRELTGGRMDESRFEHVIERVVQALDSDGDQARIATLTGRLASPQLRGVALILASDMAAADGTLHPNERKVLMSLADAFELPAHETSEMFDGFGSSGDSAGSP
jgi:tellurite resistance protein